MLDSQLNMFKLTYFGQFFIVRSVSRNCDKIPAARDFCACTLQMDSVNPIYFIAQAGMFQVRQCCFTGRFFRPPAQLSVNRLELGEQSRQPSADKSYKQI